jgi:hypothetical protein
VEEVTAGGGAKEVNGKARGEAKKPKDFLLTEFLPKKQR